MRRQNHLHEMKRGAELLPVFIFKTKGGISGAPNRMLGSILKILSIFVRDWVWTRLNGTGFYGILLMVLCRKFGYGLFFWYGLIGKAGEEN